MGVETKSVEAYDGSGSARYICSGGVGGCVNFSLLGPPGLNSEIKLNSLRLLEGVFGSLGEVGDTATESEVSSSSGRDDPSDQRDSQGIGTVRPCDCSRWHMKGLVVVL